MTAVLELTGQVNHQHQYSQEQRYSQYHLQEEEQVKLAIDICHRESRIAWGRSFGVIGHVAVGTSAALAGSVYTGGVDINIDDSANQGHCETTPVQTNDAGMIFVHSLYLSYVFWVGDWVFDFKIPLLPVELVYKASKSKHQ